MSVIPLEVVHTYFLIEIQRKSPPPIIWQFKFKVEFETEFKTQSCANNSLILLFLKKSNYNLI